MSGYKKQYQCVATMWRNRWWWLAGLGALILLGTGGYTVLTKRMSGPRWDRLLPAARAKAEQLIGLAQQTGLPVMFWEGWRSPEASAANMAAGTSKIKDPLDSLHIWGVAFDLVFQDAAGLPSWPPAEDPRWRQLAELGQSIGLMSGGLKWGWDWPHFQLPGYNAGQIRSRWGSNYLAFLSNNGATVA